MMVGRMGLRSVTAGTASMTAASMTVGVAWPHEIAAPTAQWTLPQHGNHVRAAVQTSPSMAAGALQALGDDAALAVLRGIVRPKGDADGMKAEVAAWADALTGKAKLTVLEHTAAAYIVRSGMFADEPEIHAKLDATVRKSWLQLTGSDAGDCYGRLPRLVLRHASRKARVYHAASFQPACGLRRPEDLAARQAASSLLRDYVPEHADIAVAATAMLALAFTTTGAPLIASALTTYGVFALSEAILHRFAGHQYEDGLAHWIKTPIAADAPWLKRKLHAVLHKVLAGPLELTRISHGIVHHHLTFKTFTKMFDSAEHKARVDAWIAKLPPGVAKSIIEELYGSTLSLLGCVRVLRSVAPQTAALVLAGVAFGAPPICALPLALIALSFPLSMRTVHPLQHVEKDKAAAEAGPVVGRILSTRWAAWSTRSHELHHEGKCNYNLAFAGADSLLGTYVQPNLEDCFRMEDDGVRYY